MQGRSARAAAGALLLAGVVAGCGASANGTAKSPTVLNRLAARQLTTAGFRFSLSGQLALNTSQLQGVPAKDMPMLAMIGRALRLEVVGEVAGRHQWRLTVSMPPLLSQPITEESVGGQVYVSHDGVHFQERSASPSSSTSGGVPSLRGMTSMYSQFGQVRDLGMTRMDGLRLEHLRVTVNTERLMQAVERHLTAGAGPGSNLAPFARGLVSAIHFTTYQVDEYVNPSNGRPDQLTLHMGLALDLNQLRSVMRSLPGASASGAAAPAAEGSLGVTITVQMHISDYGAHFTITKPAHVTPGTSTGTGTGLFNFA